MDSIVNRLTEIEDAASAIVRHAEEQKEVLDQEYEKKRKAFDDELEEKTRARLDAIREDLEKKTSAILENHAICLFQWSGQRDHFLFETQCQTSKF